MREWGHGKSNEVLAGGGRTQVIRPPENPERFIRRLRRYVVSKLNPNVEDHSGYGHVMQALAAHDSVLQGYRRMFLTANSFLVSAASLLLRFGGEVSGRRWGASADRLFAPAASSLFLMLGVITMLAWVVVCERRADTVTYLNYTARRIEAGDAPNVALMTELVRPFMEESWRERKRLIRLMRTGNRIQHAHRLWMGRVVPGVYGVVWAVLAAGIGYAWMVSLTPRCPS